MGKRQTTCGSLCQWHSLLFPLLAAIDTCVNTNDQFSTPSPWLYAELHKCHLGSVKHASIRHRFTKAGSGVRPSSMAFLQPWLNVRLRIAKGERLYMRRQKRNIRARVRIWWRRCYFMLCFGPLQVGQECGINQTRDFRYKYKGNIHAVAIHDFWHFESLEQCPMN